MRKDGEDMRRLTKGIVCVALLAALGGTALTAQTAYSLRDTLSAHKRDSLHDTLRLRSRVTQLEQVVGEWSSQLLEKDSQPGDVAVDAPVGTAPAETESSSVGEVTHPGAQAAELPEETGPVEAAAYRIAAYGDIIGVFDADGQLLHTINVRLDTLPEVDRTALAEGIQAADRQEMMDIVRAYS